VATSAGPLEALQSALVAKGVSLNVFAPSVMTKGFFPPGGGVRASNFSGAQRHIALILIKTVRDGNSIAMSREGGKVLI
jgi:hypothetical protein